MKIKCNHAAPLNPQTPKGFSLIHLGIDTHFSPVIDSKKCNFLSSLNTRWIDFTRGCHVASVLVKLAAK